MNAAKYVQVLQNSLLPKAVEWFGAGGEFIFQHDNAPCHKAALTRHFLDQNHIHVMEWPPYSPDCNPIENLWAVLKRKIHEHSYSNKAEVVAEILRQWYNDQHLSSCCIRLSDSMPNRVRECLKSRGSAINY
jgi:hypothetical protein